MRQDATDQLSIGDVRRRSGLGKARVARWIGQNAWQRIQLQNVWLSMGIETYVNAAPIPTLQCQKSVVAELGDGLGEVHGQVGGAAQDVEWTFRGIPKPFRCIGV